MEGAYIYRSMLNTVVNPKQYIWKSKLIDNLKRLEFLGSVIGGQLASYYTKCFLARRRFTQNPWLVHTEK